MFAIGCLQNVAEYEIPAEQPYILFIQTMDVKNKTVMATRNLCRKPAKLHAPMHWNVRLPHHLKPPKLFSAFSGLLISHCCVYFK